MSFKAYVRYVGSTSNTYLMFTNIYAYIVNTSGGFASASATSTSGTWYDVFVRCDGDTITLWRKQQGTDNEFQQLATLTDNRIPTTTAYFEFYLGSAVLVDNVRIVSNDLSTTTTFAYDAANELTAQTTNGVTTSYTYDDWGRTWSKSMQSGAHLATYKYRYGHRLADFTSTFPDETGSMMWVTDGLGRRRISQTNGGTGRHHWRWAGLEPIAEYEDADATWWPTTKVKASIPGLAEKNELAGVYRYYSTDLLGSVRRMRNDAKASLATYEYEPYGGAYYNSGIALGFGFTGHQWNPSMGLYFAPYRWYNPSAARWLTRDPLGMVDGPNVYAYVQGNPTSYLDPDGRGLITYLACVATDFLNPFSVSMAGPEASIAWVKVGSKIRYGRWFYRFIPWVGWVLTIGSIGISHEYCKHLLDPPAGWNIPETAPGAPVMPLGDGLNYCSVDSFMGGDGY